jgi:hypothetical protein
VTAYIGVPKNSVRNARVSLVVTPVKAGVQNICKNNSIAAFAGMTESGHHESVKHLGTRHDMNFHARSQAGSGSEPTKCPFFPNARSDVPEVGEVLSYRFFFLF